MPHNLSLSRNEYQKERKIKLKILCIYASIGSWNIWREIIVRFQRNFPQNLSPLVHHAQKDTIDISMPQKCHKINLKSVSFCGILAMTVHFVIQICLFCYSPTKPQYINSLNNHCSFYKFDKYIFRCLTKHK